MKKSFVTYLGSDNFLPGILALDYSLKKFNPGAELLVLAVEDISPDIISLLEKNSFHIRKIQEIKNPYQPEWEERGLRCMFSKLKIFDLTEFDKVVYIDADMLVCENIVPLFDAPHMSAVIAGAVIPENSNWTKLNAGMLVVKPDRNLFDDMLSKIGTLESEAKEDQSFLHSYYPEWPGDTTLHLDQKFNIAAPYLDQYAQLPGYRFSFQNECPNIENISIIHYWGANKPWNYTEEKIEGMLDTKYGQALDLWWNYFYKAAEKLE